MRRTDRCCNRHIGTTRPGCAPCNDRKKLPGGRVKKGKLIAGKKSIHGGQPSQFNNLPLGSLLRGAFGAGPAGVLYLQWFKSSGLWHSKVQLTVMVTLDSGILMGGRLVWVA
jgi:hypothetical protein